MAVWGGGEHLIPYHAYCPILLRVLTSFCIPNKPHPLTHTHTHTHTHTVYLIDPLNWLYINLYARGKCWGACSYPLSQFIQQRLVQCVTNRHCYAYHSYTSLTNCFITLNVLLFCYRFYSTPQVEQHVQTITLSTQCPSPRPPPNALPLSPVPPVTVTTSAGV